MTTTEDQTTLDRIDSLIIEFDKSMSSFKNISADLKTIRKTVVKETKAKSPRTKKSRDNIDPDTGEQKEKRPSALETPVKISDELSKFLSFTVGEPQSRQIVSKNLVEYVKKYDLQNPENKRFILLDTCDEGKRLSELLRTPDQPLTFFNIQRYLRPHYPPSQKELKERAKAEKAAGVVPTLDTAAATAVVTQAEPTPQVVPDAAVVTEASPTVEVEIKKKTPRRLVRKTA
jgi:chromatin remodeling complex protein RSC6